MKKENSINRRRKNKSHSKRRTVGGSNTFLGGAPGQRTSMKIKKGNSKPRQKSNNLSGSLRLLSQASFAMAKPKEESESNLQVCEEQDENSENAIPQQIQKSSNNFLNANQEEEILEVRDQEMESSEEKGRVLVYNTPTKSEPKSQELEDDEFNF